MESVILVVNSVGGVIAVFTTRKLADTFIRQMNCHPLMGHGGSSVYYDKKGNYMYSLKQFTVQK